MAASDAISGKIAELLSANWDAIVADANANKGATRIGYSVSLKKNSEGVFDFSVSQNFRIRQEVSAPKVVTAKGVA